MKGIENLKEASAFICHIANGISLSLADGKASWTDAFNFKDALFAALPAFKDLGEVDDEYLDMDESEEAELSAYVAQVLKLDPKHKKVEDIAETALHIIIQLNDLVSEIVKAKKA